MTQINFDTSLTELLMTVIEDLFYPSESDEKLEIVDFGCDVILPLNENDFREILKIKPKAKMEILPFENFFSVVIDNQEWWTDYENERMRKFLILKDILENKLTDLTFVRIGRVEIEAYLLGKDKFDGTTKGIKTLIVES